MRKHFTLRKSRVYSLAVLFWAAAMMLPVVSRAVYCTPTGTGTGTYYLSSFSTTGGILNITNNNSGFSAGGYGNFTATQTVSNTPGNTFNFSGSFPAGYTFGVKVWVDWNQDTDFDDAGEQVFATTGYVSSFSGTVTIPGAALTGSTRMRVGVHYLSGTGPTSCLTGNAYTEFEDYTVTVVPLVPCATATFPASATASAAPSAVCVSGNVNLTFTPATPMPAASGLTYQWQSAPAAGGPWTNIGTASATSSYTAAVSSPTSTNIYFRVQVLCNGTPTTLTSSATAAVAINNPGTPTVTPGSRCGPGSVALSAVAPAGSTLNWYAAPTGGLPLQTGGASFNTPYIPTTTNFYVAAASGSSPATPQIGTAITTAGGTSYVPGPFSVYYRRSTMQFLYTSAELIAAGGGSGTINSIAFNCTGLPIYAMPNYKVSICTVPGSMTTLTWQPTANLTQVYTSASYLPSATGWQTLTFSTPVNYVAGDNIVVQVCWDQVQPTYNASGNHEYTTQTGRMLYTWTDAAGSSCGETGTTTSTNLPNVRFGMTLGCTGPRIPVLATVNSSPVVARTSPAVVCNNSVAAITLTPPTPAYPSYNWSPATNLFTNAAATTPYVSGNSATSVYMKTTNVGQQTYYMMAGNPALTTGCTFADTVRVWVQPAPTAITGTPDSICVSGNTVLALSPATGYSPNSIQWQESTNGTTYTTIAGATNPSYTTPTLTTNRYYRAIVKSTSDTCITLNKLVVVVVPTLLGATDSFNCGPGTVTLQAQTGGNSTAKWYDVPTGGNPVASGSPFTTPYLGATTTYYVAAEGGAGGGSPITVQVGNGTSSYGGTSFSAGPFSVYYRRYTMQFLYTAAEVLAAGGNPGNVTSIAFNCTGLPLYAIPSYTIRIKFVPSTMTTLTWQTTGLTQVYTNASYMPTTGWQTFPFSSNLVWNGTDNIVVEVCRSQVQPTYNSSGNHQYTTVTGRMLSNNSDAAGSSCGVTGTTTSTYLPNVRFGMQAPCQTPRLPVIAYIRPVPVVDLGGDVNKCIDPGYAEVLDAGVQPNNPSFLWDNGSVSQVRAVTESGSYNVTVTNEYTCKDSDTINVILRRNPVVELGNDTTVCNGVVLNLNPGNNGIEYFWNTGQTSQNINVSSPGTYSVFVTNSQGCTKADTIVVNMQGELPTIQGIQTTNNGQYTFHFTAVNPQNVIGYDWDFGDGSAHSYQASPTHTYPNAGNYIVVLHLSSSCGFFSDSSSAHILGINQLNVDNNEMTVYPNPTKENATILNRGALKMESISVYNVLGQVVYHEKADSKDKHTLNLSGMASGVYTIQIFTDKGTVARKLELIK